MVVLLFFQFLLLLLEILLCFNQHIFYQDLETDDGGGTINHLRLMNFCIYPPRGTSPPSVRPRHLLRGVGSHRPPEVQLWGPLQQIYGLCGHLVPPLTWGEEGGAKAGDHRPHLCRHWAGRLQPAVRRQGTDSLEHHRVQLLAMSY